MFKRKLYKISALLLSAIVLFTSVDVVALAEGIEVEEGIEEEIKEILSEEEGDSENTENEEETESVISEEITEEISEEESETESEFITFEEISEIEEEEETTSEEKVLGEEDANYLTFTAEEANSTISFRWFGGSNVMYKLDNDSWKSYVQGKLISLDEIGSKVSFKGKNIRTYAGSHFEMTGKISASGSVTSLTDGYGVDENVHLSYSCYADMFLGCSSLTSAPELPATQLAESCYSSMFYNCSSLTSAPELPATQLADSRYSYISCYSHMFYGCSSLTRAPELPATQLAEYCYSNMFSGCSSLTSAPELPATQLAEDCYFHMFEECSSLTNAPELPATQLAKYCYSNMFSGCSSLTSAPELPATQLAESCYSDMFGKCSSLTNAPELPATQLAWQCYRSMFYRCPISEIKLACGIYDDEEISYLIEDITWPAPKDITITYIHDCYSISSITHECKRCSARSNHSYKKEIKSGLEGQCVVKETCTNNGTYKKYCSVCKVLSTETFEVPAVGSHSYISEVNKDLEGQCVVKETCTNNGIYKKYCSVCEGLSTETFEVEATGNHDFSDEGICETCKYICLHGDEEGWFIVDGQCSFCGAEVEIPVDSENNPVYEEIPEQLWVTGVINKDFTGSKIEQTAMKVYWGSKQLVSGKDYTVKYQNNMKAGIATVIITGKGNYSGSIKKEFIINSLDLGKAMALDDEITLLYTGKNQTPVTTFTMEVDGKTITLKSGKDFKYSYPEIKDVNDEEHPYVVTVNGCGNYKGSKTINVYVVKDVIPVSKLTVKKIPNQDYKNGKQIIPEVVVMNGKMVLKKDEDYTVEVVADANKKIGLGMITIVGNGTDYVGRKSVSFNIVGTPISKAVVEGLGAYTYTGSSIVPTGYKLYMKETPEKPLAEGANQDYVVTLNQNINAGTATITFTGVNGYSGTLKKTFKINKASMTDWNRIIVETEASVEYDKNGAKPAVIVTDLKRNQVLTEGVDYTVKYTNNKECHSLNDVKKPEVTVTGKGNYSGTSIPIYFAISKKSFATADISATDIVALNKADICKPVFKLNGVALKAGVDYNTNVEYTYAKDTMVSYSTRKAGSPVNKTDFIPAGTEINAKLTGIGNYKDTKIVTFRYVEMNIASAKVVIPNQVYTKKEIKLTEENISVTMTVNKMKETLVLGRDFEIISYQNNVNTGKAKVVIKGIGAFGGTKEVTFKIVTKTMNYNITFMKNDDLATGNMKSINVPAGTKLPANVFKHSTKQFKEWNTKADGKGQSYTDKEAFVKKGWNILSFGDSFTLYAIWE